MQTVAPTQYVFICTPSWKEKWVEIILSTFLIIHHNIILNLYRIMTTMKFETDNFPSIEARPVGLDSILMKMHA